MQALVRFSATLARAIIPEALRASWLYQSARHTFMPHDLDYNYNYYVRDVETPASQGAVVMARSITDFFKPKTVIDVGCGTGALLASFRDLGCDVQGLEYASAGIELCETRGLPVLKFNIERDSFTEPGSFDIAVSFEVAEHLPSWSANRYVALLCRLAPVVVMSAARPGQAGTDHLNLQSPAYWIKKFAELGCKFEEDVRDQFSKQWHAAGVAGFYSKNLLVFSRLTTGSAARSTY